VSGEDPRYPGAPTPTAETVVEPTLEQKLVEHVRGWLARNAKVVRDRGDVASLTLRLREPGWDDDGTLVLTWSYEETVNGPACDEDGEGRVPGLKGQRGA
jgi:hypothetical protein